MADERSQRNKAVAAAALAALGFYSSAHASVVIQEIYGDGGFTSSSTYSNDYVQLYNDGTAAVNITGYKLEVGGYSGALGAATYQVLALTGTSVAPASYYLIELPPGGSAATGTGILPFPAPNQAATAYANNPVPSYYDGKIGLVDSNGNIVDYVGYSSDQSSGTYPAYVGTGPAAGNAGTTGVAFSGTNALTRVIFTDDTSGTGDYGTENNGADFVSDVPHPIPAAVPEPMSAGLLAVGGALMLARRKR